MGNYRNWDIVDKIRNNYEDLPLIGSIWAMGALDMKEKLGVFDAPLEEMNQDEVVSDSSMLTNEIAQKALFGKLSFEGGHPFKLIPDGFEVTF